MSWLYDIVGIEAFLVLLAPLTGFAHKGPKRGTRIRTCNSIRLQSCLRTNHYLDLPCTARSWLTPQLTLI